MMTETGQNSSPTGWQQMRQEGSQRASRIRQIVGAAAVATGDELKAGTAELQTISRKALADMIERLNRQAADGSVAAAGPETGASTMTADTPDLGTDSAQGTAREIPSWREIVMALWRVVNARKGGWSYQAVTRLQAQMAQFDADMAAEYGDRYGRFQPVITRLRQWVQQLATRLDPARAEDGMPAVPVQIEVLDPEDGAPSKAC